jgi:hypothetical protein
LDEKNKLYLHLMSDIILKSLNAEQQRQMRMRMMRGKSVEILEIVAIIKTVPGPLNKRRSAY